VNKSERIEVFIKTLGFTHGGHEEHLGNEPQVDPCYLGYFECFNTRRYYEAHDVLEHLWLKDGREAPDYAFYKGLIQLAGAFVHLKLQHAHPLHPKHGKRLAPARRLFLLAQTNLMPYAPHHHYLDLKIPIRLASRYADRLATASEINPWSPECAPILPVPNGIV